MMDDRTPRVRFAGFTDPWEQRKLGDIATKVMKKNSDLAVRETFTNSAERGVVSQLDYFDHDITNDDNIGNYIVVEPDDFVYNPRISVTAPVGPINRNRLLRTGVMSPLYTVFRIDATVDHGYLEHYFKTSLWHAFMNLEGNTGARSDRFSISDSTFFEMPISCPRKAEQSAIADFLESFDNLITLHQRELDKLKAAKQSMLERMFPRDGADVPELRFAGFNDPWEQRKLGDVCTFEKGRGYSKADIEEEGVPLVLYGRLYTKYESLITSVDTFATPREGSLYSRGDEVVVPASGETAEDIAVASHIGRSGMLLGGDLNVVTPSSGLDPTFLAMGITYGSPHGQLAKRAQGKSVVHIHNEDIADVEFSYPGVPEQREITSMMLCLDNLITLHQRESDKLKAVKQSFLQNMFV